MLAELWLLFVVIGFWLAVRRSLARYSDDELEQAALLPLHDEPDDLPITGKEF